jgi:hypothetical protein
MVIPSLMRFLKSNPKEIYDAGYATVNQPLTQWVGCIVVRGSSQQVLQNSPTYLTLLQVGGNVWVDLRSIDMCPLKL